MGDSCILFFYLSCDKHWTAQETIFNNSFQYYIDPQIFIKLFLYIDNIQSRTEHWRPYDLPGSYSHIA